MQDWAQRYRKIDPFPAVPDDAAVWLSPATSDPWWDDFLRSTSHGQFQQSSLWAEFKAGEGWDQHRVVITGANGIAGGFQLLWKKRGPLRIGYVSKGPVAHPEMPALRPALARLLLHSARKLSLNALITQSPDDAPAEEESADEQLGFIRSNPMKTVEATYLVNVGEDMKTVRQRMNRTMRKCLRKSQEQGLVVRRGTEADLPLFFSLMSATCRRQETKPNPASLESLQRLWRLFAPHDSVEMSFASRQGADIAGLMNLIFGERATQWKIGWDGSHPHSHPNELLVDHGLELAQTRGCRICDFAAMSRPTAEHILSGAPIDTAMTRSRDMFKLRLGGYPQLLPRARILVPNPILRWGFRNSYARFERIQELRRTA